MSIVRIIIIMYISLFINSLLAEDEFEGNLKSIDSTLRENVIKRVLLERSNIINQCIDIINNKKDYDLQSRLSFESAITILNEFRSIESIPLLINNIDYHQISIIKKDEMFKPICVSALINIGTPSLKHLLTEMKISTNEYRKRLLLLTFYEIARESTENYIKHELSNSITLEEKNNLWQALTLYYLITSIDNNKYNLMFYKNYTLVNETEYFVNLIYRNTFTKNGLFLKFKLSNDIGDYSTVCKEYLFYKLLTGTKEEQKIAAQEVGNRYDNLNDFTQRDINIINIVVEKYFDISLSDSIVYNEVNLQIQRLWLSSTHCLLETIKKRPSSKHVELAIDNLIRMKNREIILMIIKEYNILNNKEQKEWFLYLLYRMNENINSDIPNRKCSLSDYDSNILYNNLILPFINKNVSDISSEEIPIISSAENADDSDTELFHKTDSGNEGEKHGENKEP